MILRVCANCKFWSSRDREWGWCDLAQSEDGVPIHREALAYARDIELYSASLTTNRKFGCNQFKES